MRKEFKVVFYPAIGTDNVFERECDSFSQAEIILDTIADYSLMLGDSGLMSDHSNSGVIQKLVKDEWLDIDIEQYKK